MKYEEALQSVLMYCSEECGKIDSCRGEYKECIEATVIKALEKQIPKKPLHMHKNYYCPICKEDGWILWDDAVPNDMDEYCGKCGQAIDWSDCHTKMDLDI